MLAPFILVFVIITNTASQPCKPDMSVELKNRSYKGVKYLDGEYYVDNNTQLERGCICMKQACVRKCCPQGKAYNGTTCVPEPHKFHLPVYRGYNSKYPIKGFNATENFHFVHGKMRCNDEINEKRIILGNLVFRIVKDGNLYVEVSNHIPSIFIYGPDQYCIDTFVSDKPHLNGLICFVPKPEKDNYVLIISCMLTSCFFILLTVVVYAWLPELLNLHGMVLIVYLLCFFVSFLFLATMQILILKKKIDQDFCTVLTFIIYFSLLAAFFWLNVICYDIWWTFSGNRAHGHSGSQHKRFIYYAIYAFGVPTALTITLAALEFFDLPIQPALLPKLRLQGCFMYGNSKLLYLYGPIVIICVANMVFFGLTAYKIRKIKKETSILHSNESSTHNQDRKETERFTLYVKLFTVMGINWILEVVSCLFPFADYIWQFSDAYNIVAVGLIIFVIFVCKKKTWHMIKERYRPLTRDPLDRTQTTTSTSTRNHSTMTTTLLSKRNANEVH